MSSAHPKIAIVGGGPGGLTLALVLHQHGVPATVYELRQRPTEEELDLPSGSLDLHEESGLKAIQACGLLDTFSAYTSDCSEAWKIINAAGVALYTDEGSSNRPEIARHQLMRLLLSKLPDDKIKWGSKISSAERVGDGKTKLDFGDHAEVFDVVVGADGSWSRIRPLVSDAKPEYTGLQNLTLTITNLPERYPELAHFCGDGTMCVLEDGDGIIMGQRGVRQSERLYITMASAHEDFAEREKVHDMDADALHQYLVTTDSLYKTFADMPKKLIKAACDDSAAPVNRGATTRYDLRPFYKLPIGHHWKYVPGITIIGDAAHLMTPYAGEGVNLAMRDALDVGAAVAEAWQINHTDIVAFQKALAPLLEAVEAQMQTRAGEKAEETESNRQLLFGEDAAQKFATLMKGYIGPPES
ncbi:salicylate hydroxylase [Akanthomyces lecanii RCEF 1005]|uniref:Salicylate hydroxylase n=1 Tax=Akanthomyces lecanii RCEF 1005 TaxID=1081108 RepID=A0A162KBH3_CORDF|nr:salicylate hydroxylase [Akanthomyces lecanii RCEF 1005]